jgi:hypothetical protein
VHPGLLGPRAASGAWAPRALGALGGLGHVRGLLALGGLRRIRGLLALGGLRHVRGLLALGGLRRIRGLLTLGGLRRIRGLLALGGLRHVRGLLALGGLRHVRGLLVGDILIRHRSGFPVHRLFRQLRRILGHLDRLVGLLIRRLCRHIDAALIRDLFLRPHLLRLRIRLFLDGGRIDLDRVVTEPGISPGSRASLMSRTRTCSPVWRSM